MINFCDGRWRTSDWRHSMETSRSCRQFAARYGSPTTHSRRACDARRVYDGAVLLVGWADLPILLQAEYLAPEMLDQLQGGGMGYGPEVPDHVLARFCQSALTELPHSVRDSLFAVESLI